LDLDDSIACGDGWVDRAAGEECDPAVPESYEGKCSPVRQDAPVGQGACDPTTCELDVSEEQCAVCGDGRIDTHKGEQCDGILPPDALCPDGSPNVICAPDCTLDFRGCPRCGNGVLDAAFEECDPLASGDLVQPVDCETLSNGYYTSGTAVHCLPDCTYDRTNCGFCGNGRLNAEVPYEEVCDGDRIDPVVLEEYCRERCTGTVLGSMVFDCNFECADDCLSLEDVEDEDLACCVPPGEDCPEASDYQCCWELDPENADSPDSPCIDVITGEDMRRVCR
jgi:hypothetical protein